MRPNPAAPALAFPSERQKRDRNIYLPCIGWLLLDGAVIAGALRYG